MQQVRPVAIEDGSRREVDDSMETPDRGGGYVFCAAHHISPDVSPERIEVMYQAALALGVVAA